MKKKHNEIFVAFSLTALLVLAGLLCLAAVSPKLGLFNAYLQTDLNGNNKSLTNVLALGVGSLRGNITATGTLTGRFVGDGQGLTNICAAGRIVRAPAWIASSYS